MRKIEKDFNNSPEKLVACEKEHLSKTKISSSCYKQAKTELRSSTYLMWLTHFFNILTICNLTKRKCLKTFVRLL